MNALQWLNSLRPALPMSVEQAGDKSEPHAKHACTRTLMLAELLALASEHDAVD